MQALSKVARCILDRMEPDRRYGAVELRAFVPDSSAEQLREVMHELWINRQVERIGYAAWRRQRSVPPHAPHPVSGEAQPAKPEELFDHDAFADFFK